MKVAIAGYGIEGKTSYQYWSQRGDDVTIVDERQTLDNVPDGARTVLGPDALAHLDDFELVIRTASLRPDRIHTSGKVWSATNEFFAKCPAPIIGITGTKGKGTTCSFITSILRAAGKTVHLVGNIGVPALEILPEIQPSDIVVYELSSFQLWDIECSPHIAVVLTIEPDHLDVHASMDEYVNAKAQIAQHQTANDKVVYHPTSPGAQQIAAFSPGDRYRYASDESVYVKKDMFWANSGAICSVAAVVLPGRHNVENACAAIAAVQQYDKAISARVIEQGLRNFTGLPHRLKFIREVSGVQYYDDSYSSAPNATAVAIRAFDAPIELICGGYDRGLDYGELAQAIVERTNVKHVHLMGQTRHAIADKLRDLGLADDRYTVHDTQQFDKLFLDVVSSARPGDIVLLSPGCASFDMFKNFTDRGEQFIRLVEAL